MLFAVVLAVFTLKLTATALGVALKPPIINLGYGSFQGAITGNLTTFLGMPFAAPPVGELRFNPPQPPPSFSGVRQATRFGAACPQQSAVPPSALNVSLLDSSAAPSNISEDCLFINVVKPTSIPEGKKLPVLFWVYGGGFIQGDTSENPGNPVVERSIALDEPVIYVSANYRVSVFGFLGGKEVQEAGVGNLGLRDQRLALQWVQQHISAFGGDSRRVTIWGQSAGAVSVGLQMVTNDGDPAGLFHGVFMQSGSPTELRNMSASQPLYDQLVINAGCDGSANTLDCLRELPFDKLMTAVNKSPNYFSFTGIWMSWAPRVDGVFLVRDPKYSFERGLYAKVPFVTGDCEDEGTLFSFSSLNITTNDEFLAYISENLLQGASTAELTAVGDAYSDNIADGSPFNTGDTNAISPQFKRIAAMQGDLVFQAARRFFLQTAAMTQDSWAYLYKRGKTTPGLGSYHGSDVPDFYGSNSQPDFIGTDALVNFANNLDPTVPRNPISLLSTVTWEQWGTSATSPPILTFLDSAPSIAITSDDYRLDEMNLLNRIQKRIA